MKTNIKEWIIHCMSVLLFQQCKDAYRDANSREQACKYASEEHDALTYVLSNKSAIFFEELTLIGYLITIFRLFKVAFLTKKRHAGSKVLWGFVE